MKDEGLNLMESTTPSNLMTTALKEFTFVVEGVKRTAMVYIPPASVIPHPIMFAFHGHGGTATGFATKHQFEAFWTTRAIVVYPQGLKTVSGSDPAGDETGWQSRWGDINKWNAIKDQDIKFFDEMLSFFVEKQNADPTLVFAHGWSNGGIFIYNALWAARGGKLAAIAPSSATLKTSIGKNMMPCLATAGVQDPVVDFASQNSSVLDVISLNNCNPTGKYAGGHPYPDQVPELIVKFFRQIYLTK
jgi:polyhydroxybutyrate depolymerase